MNTKDDPLGTARGMMLGVVLGMCIWAVLLLSIKACVA
jgi:hypothetical protein